MVYAKIFKILIFVSAFLTLHNIYTYFYGDLKVIKFILPNDIRFDKRKDPNESTIFQHISLQMPYLPIEDLTNANYIDRHFNETCATYPLLADVQIKNDYWQEYRHENWTIYIFGAYLDNRPTVVENEPVIRILTMINFFGTQDESYPITYCQFWYEEQREPIIVPVKNVHRLWHNEWSLDFGQYYGHFLSCPLPEEHQDWIPRTVSLVSAPCDKATNNVRIVYQPLKEGEVKQGFVVCIKGLDYPYVDMSHRLVEYIETMRSLGAAKIVLYNLQVHPNITKVLRYYELAGFIEFRPFSLSLNVGNLPEYRHMDNSRNRASYRLHEVIPYNDCLYRNMYHYQYVAVVDTDEVLMPLGNFTNWHDLMKFAENINEGICQKYTSFCFRCSYFPSYPENTRYTNEFPEYFYMLQHVERLGDHLEPDLATKCLHNTDRILATHNHVPFHWVADACRHYTFNVTHAQLNHYREPDIKEIVGDPVVDRHLWRFKDEIIQRSMKVFKDLDFF